MSAVSHLRVAVDEGFEARDELGQFYPSDFAEEQQEQARPRKQRVHRARASYPATALCAVCLLVLALGFLAQKTRLVSLANDLAVLQEELAAAQRMQSFLQLELMKARSPRQIEYQARGRLGMQEPQRVEYLVVDPSYGQADTDEGETDAHDNNVITVAAKWLTENWPRWGRAEASHLQ